MKHGITRLFTLCVAAFAVQFSFFFAQTNTKPARPTARPAKPETPHLAFVTEYIRELAAVERLRAAGEAENNQDKKDDKLPFASAIHTSTLFELELGSQVEMLKSMRLNKPFDFLIPTITAFYEREIVLWRRMRERGNLDFIDQALFEATPSVFATLIDMKEDSKGHASHLIITKEEEVGLISKLDDSFGAKLDQKDPNYIVGSARVLKDYLLKGYKCSDEPWD